MDPWVLGQPIGRALVGFVGFLILACGIGTILWVMTTAIDDDLGRIPKMEENEPGLRGMKTPLSGRTPKVVAPLTIPVAAARQRLSRRLAFESRHPRSTIAEYESAEGEEVWATIAPTSTLQSMPATFACGMLAVNPPSRNVVPNSAPRRKVRREKPPPKRGKV